MSLIGSTSLYPITNSSTGNMTVSTRISTTGGSDIIPMTSNTYHYPYSTSLGLGSSYYSDLSMYNALADTGQQAQGMGVEDGDILSSSNAVYEPMVQGSLGYNTTQTATNPWAWGVTDWISAGMMGVGLGFGGYNMAKNNAAQLFQSSSDAKIKMAGMFGIDTTDYAQKVSAKTTADSQVEDLSKEWGKSKEKKDAKTAAKTATSEANKAGKVLDQTIADIQTDENLKKFKLTGNLNLIDEADIKSGQLKLDSTSGPKLTVGTGKTAKFYDISQADFDAMTKLENDYQEAVASGDSDKLTQTGKAYNDKLKEIRNNYNKKTIATSKDTVIDTKNINKTSWNNQIKSSGGIKLEKGSKLTLDGVDVELTAEQAQKLKEAQNSKLFKNSKTTKVVQEIAAEHNKNAKPTVTAELNGKTCSIPLDADDAVQFKKNQDIIDNTKSNWSKHKAQKANNKLLKNAAQKAANVGTTSKGALFKQSWKGGLASNICMNVLNVGVTGFSEIQQTGELGKQTTKALVTGIVNTLATTTLTAACSIIPGGPVVAAIVGTVAGGAITTGINKLSSWICSKIPGWSDEEIAQENAEKAAKKNGTFVDPSQAQASGPAVITSSQLEAQLSQMTSDEQATFMAQLQEAIQAGQIVLQ